MLLTRACPGCQDSVPLAVTASGDTCYLGWICTRCLADDADDGLLDEEYLASLESRDLDDAFPSGAWRR